MILLLCWQVSWPGCRIRPEAGVPNQAEARRVRGSYIVRLDATGEGAGYSLILGCPWRGGQGPVCQAAWRGVDSKPGPAIMKRG